MIEKLGNRYRKLRQQRISEWMTRPFQLGDLQAVPHHWKVRAPDFVGVATGKAGTSWWYRLLLDHPSIKPNRLGVKELNYFYHFTYHGIDPAAVRTYCQAFAAPPGCICGEWSPGYLTFPLAMNYLAQAAPNARLLAIVRNPVDCMLSTMNQYISVRERFLGFKGKRAHIFRTFSSFPAAVSNCLLSPSFRYLSRFFDPSQVLVLQYERCKADPAAEIAETFRFLGVDDSYVPADLEARVNVRPYALSRLTHDERTLLVELFSEDVRSLLSLFPQIDLALWPDFNS